MQLPDPLSLDEWPQNIESLPDIMWWNVTSYSLNMPSPFTKAAIRNNKSHVII